MKKGGYMKKMVIGACMIIVLLAAQETGQKIVMKPAIVNLEEMTIMGIQTLTSSGYNIIPHLWDRFMQRYGEIKDIADEKVHFGISFGFEEIPKAEGKDIKIFYHLVGARVNSTEDIPEGMTYKDVPAHMYAKFTHQGPISRLGETYGYIYGQWLPQSGFLYDTEAVEIEWYDARFKGRDDERSEFDILVPIIKNKDVEK